MSETMTAAMALATRKLADARWRVAHETAAWGAPAREATRRCEAALREVRHLELVEAAADCRCCEDLPAELGRLRTEALERIGAGLVDVRDAADRMRRR